MQKETSALIASHIRRAFEKSQKMEADIFGIGLQYHRKFPKYWRELGNDWKDTYRSMNIDIRVTTKIRRFGLLERVPFFDYHVRSGD
jgi:spore germination protein KC